MILSVVRDYHWPPYVIKNLFHDAEDYNGLEFWYNEVVATHEELKKKTPPKTPGK